MGRRKKTSSRSLSETEPRSANATLPECSSDFLEGLSILTAAQAKYLLNHSEKFTEIFQDNTPGFNIVHQTCKEGNTPLLCDILKLMNVALANNLALEAQDLESKYTALHDAISYGNINCAVKLLQHGASMSTPASDGLTPLDVAVWNQFKNGFVPESKNLNVLTWGTNCNYNLGHSHDGNLRVPEKVKRFNRDKFVSSICNVNFGKYHTLFLDKSGNVYSCGYGKGGRLGLGSEQTYLEPTLIPGLKNIVKISCSNDHSLALAADGRVYSWGINTNRVLGHPEPKNVAKPQALKAPFAFDKIVTVKAAKYHSILVAADQIYTFGFNGGQIGHMFSEEEHQIVPRSVTRLRHTPGDTLGKIAHVHTSAAATVIGFENGAIFVCNQYDIKKVATLNRFDHTKIINFQHAPFLAVKTKKIRVTGGSLARQATSETTNKKSKPLLITILDSNGQVFCCIPDQFKNLLLYHWDVYSEKFLVTDIALGSGALVLLTTNGEVFHCDPYPTLKSAKEIKRDHSHKTWSSISINSRKKDTLQMLRPIKLTKQMGLHNGTKVFCNGTGLVKACIVQDRVSTLDFLPSIESSTFTSEISALFDNDEVYETDINIYCESGKQISAHKALLANASDKFAKLVTDAVDSDKEYIDLPGSEASVQSLLETVYMVNVQVPSAVKRQTKHPLLHNGLLDLNKCDKIDRAALVTLSDVVLVSEEGVKYRCHRAVLAARVEYFMTHFMVNSRWGAVSLNQEIPINANKRTLSDFIYYIYTDTFPQNFTFESLMLLLRLADQYLVSRLKSFCEVSLVSFITEENLIHVLRTANDFNAFNLRAVCIHIIAMNAPYYLEHRLLDNLEEEILDQLDKVYKEVILFHLTRSPNKDYSVMEYLKYLTDSKPCVDEPVVKTPIKGLPDQLEEYVSEDEEAGQSNAPGPLSDNVPEIQQDTPSQGTSSQDIASPSPVSNSNIAEDNVASVAFQNLNINKKLDDKQLELREPLKISSPVDVSVCPSSSKPAPSRLSSWGSSDTTTQPLNRSLSEIIEEEERQKKLQKKNKEAMRAKMSAAQTPSKTKQESSRPTNAPWGALNNTPTVSLRDIMSTEPPKQKQASPRKPSNTQSPTSKQPEPRGKSETFNFMPERKVHCLRSIMEAEQVSSKAVLAKSYSKPLEVIQIEERAIKELMEFYKVDECVNEYITVNTVSENITRPAWGKNAPLNF